MNFIRNLIFYLSFPEALIYCHDETLRCVERLENLPKVESGKFYAIRYICWSVGLSLASVGQLSVCFSLNFHNQVDLPVFLRLVVAGIWIDIPEPRMARY